MKILLLGEYDINEIAPAPIKVGKELFNTFTQKAFNVVYLAYFQDGKNRIYPEQSRQERYCPNMGRISIQQDGWFVTFINQTGLFGKQVLRKDIYGDPYDVGSGLHGPL